MSPRQKNWSTQAYDFAVKDYIDSSCKQEEVQEKVADKNMVDKPKNMVQMDAKSEFFESDFYDLYHTDLKLKPEKIGVCHLEVNYETDVIDQWETRNQTVVCVSQLDNNTRGRSSLKIIEKFDNLDHEMTKNKKCDEGPIKGGMPTFEPKTQVSEQIILVHEVFI